MKTLILTLLTLSSLGFAQEKHLLHRNGFMSEGVFLGVTLQEADADTVPNSGYTGAARVLSVVDDSPAAKAELQEGDLIVAINDTATVTPRDVVKALAVFEEGDEVVLKYIRDGKPASKTIALANRKGQNYNYNFDYRMPKKWAEVYEVSRTFVGIHMMDLNEQLAAYFKVDGGVLITEVVEDSPAERAGLQAGDVITRWDESDIADQRDLRKAIHNTKPDAAANIVASRRGDTVDLSVIPEERKGAHSLFGDKGFEMRFPKNFKVEELPIIKHRLHSDEAKELREEMEALKKELQELKKNQ